MKIVKNSTLILGLLGTFSLYATKEISLTVDNTLDKPVIISCYVGNNPDAGVFGILIPAHTIEELVLPEFYWFDKHPSSGIIKKGQRSETKLVDVLKHSLPSKLELAIPNEQHQVLTIKPESLMIKISPSGSSAKVTTQKAGHE